MSSKLKCYCSFCRQITNHDILSSETTKSTDDYWWCKTYRIVQCCGCETKSFHLEEVEEADVEYDPIEEMETLVPKISTFPHSIGEIRPLDSWPIPNKILGIYLETIKAYNTQCHLLSAAGSRAIIEAICSDKSISGKNLDTKINNLHKSGHITKNDRDRLHAVRFIGNDSIHEMKKPDIRQLQLVLDIIHSLLNNLYIIGDSCKGMLAIPISNFEEFLTLLDEELTKRKIGDIDILRNFLPNDKRLIQEDLAKFEKELQDKIKKGEYTKLKLHVPSSSTKIAPPRSRYEIITI